MSQEAEELTWITASPNTDCVEVAFGESNVFVRDSKDRDGARLTFTYREWKVFEGGMASGIFDRDS